MPLADHALVVGINRYPGISALSGAENDAQNFYNWVTDPAGGGVNPANALLVLSLRFPAPLGTNDALPDKQRIEQFFTDIDDCAEANNAAQLGLKAGKRLWMFFSGHGFAPSADLSGVLMANATLQRIHNVAAKRWADRLYEGGWFDEVLLFQDACRNYIPGADLTPPFLKQRPAPVAQQRVRFYALAAKDRQLAKEMPRSDGTVHGVFTTTLLQGLRGHARDRVTGAVTTAQLKVYLQDNMRKLLPDADLDNDEIAKVPEVFDPDPFDILPSPPLPAVPEFPVRINLPQPGLTVHVEDSSFQKVDGTDPAPQVWQLRLPRGLYKVVAGSASVLFEVTGTVEADNTERVVDVRV